MLYSAVDAVREKAPVVHAITNYVSANDCANMLLACGASPIMADEAQEVGEITAFAAALCINMGTLDSRKVDSMLLAGKTANELKRPVVLDPVGAGASALRRATVRRLLEGVRFAAIRCNMSELRAIANVIIESGATANCAIASGAICLRGVDANADDAVTVDTLDSTISLAGKVAKETGAVVAVTGAIDVVTDGKIVYCIYNGNKIMSRVTGIGCQLSAMTAAYLAVNPENAVNAINAVTAAVCAMGVCGEKAFERMSALDGNAAYRGYIIDAAFHLNAKELEREARYERLSI